MMWSTNTCRIRKLHTTGTRTWFSVLFVVLFFTYTIFMLHTNENMAGSESTDIKVDYRQWSNISITTPTSSGVTSGKNVLLFGYMRSGSTLVGNFYRNSPGIFYVFEPLLPLAQYNYFTKHSICKMRDDTCEVVNDTRRIQDAISTINNLYSCNIRDVPRRVIDKVISKDRSSRVWSKFGKCLNSSKDITKKNKLQCFEDIEQACQRAEVRVFKILRLSFEHMRSFLQDIPSLHVLFLLRDPRAILNSRISTFWFPVKDDNPAGVIDHVNSLCKKMHDDIWFFEQTRVIYEEKMVQMHIEKITENEDEMMKLMHHFRHGYKMQPEDRSFLDATFQKKDTYSLFRNWRNSLKSMYVTHTEQKCADVISYLDIIKQKTLLSAG